MNAAVTYQVIGDRDACARTAQRLIEVARRFGFGPQQVLANLCSAGRGASSPAVDGLAQMEEGFAQRSL